jgi:SAM-dependent methyltransferase
MSDAHASAYWSQHAGYQANWYSFCRRYIQERVTGDASTAITPWMYRHFCPSLPLDHVLELGCLGGDMIASLVRKGVARRGSGSDIAAGAIERGRQKHGHLVNLFVMDLNRPTLPADEYSAVQANGVLHHIENLEICIEAIYDALRTGGWLFAGDFTGPRRYRYSRKEMRTIREAQLLLPLELRDAPFDPAQLAPKLALDPSEASRTRDIEPVLRAAFEHVEIRPYGGNVLMRALGKRFFLNFDAENAAHRTAIETLIAMDREVSASAPSHHHFAFARKG